MAYSKTNWVNGQTPINATNLNKIETQLEANDTATTTNTTNIATNTTDITNLQNYSTTETVIGKWIDGRTLYRKILTFEALGDNSTINVYMNISNLDIVVNYFGIAKGTRYGLLLPASHATANNNVNVFIDYQFGFIGIQTFSDRTQYTSGHIIIEYVKTAS